MTVVVNIFSRRLLVAFKLHIMLCIMYVVCIYHINEKVGFPYF